MEDMMKQSKGMMGKMMGQGQGDKEGSGGEPGGMDGMMKKGMGMMGKMMGQGGGEGSMNGMGGMMDMCKKMTQSVTKSAEIASFATEEVKGIFEDWLQQVSHEVLDAISQSGGTINLEQIAGHLSISPSSARYLVGSLFQKGLLDLGTVHVVDDARSSAPSASTDQPEITEKETKDE